MDKGKLKEAACQVSDMQVDSGGKLGLFSLLVNCGYNFVSQHKMILQDKQ